MAKNINKKELVKHIRHCINFYNSSEIDKSDGWPFVMFTPNDKTYTLCGQSEKEYRAGLNLLLDYEKLTDKYSPRGIRKGFQRLIAKMMEEYAEAPDSNVIKNELNSWLTSMLTASENEITHYMVVESIRMTERYSIGKVILEPLSQEKIEELFSRLCDRIDQNKAHSESEKEKLKQHYCEMSFVHFEPKKYHNSALISTTLLTRDLDHGQEIARERFREAIHFLRFLGDSICDYNCGQFLGLRGEVGRGQITELTFLESYGWSMPHKNLSFPIEIGRITPNHIDPFNYILVKPPEERTKMEDRLINAIVWMSKAIQDPSDSSEFLSCCIALESLLCRDVKETIGKTLSERLAFLLAENKEDRLRVFKDMKQIYGIRSKIAHEGRPKKDKDLIEYLPYVTYYAKCSIFRVAHLLKKEGWIKFDQLKNYLDDFKFS